MHFAKCGGIDPRILPGARVVVHGKCDLPGVISTLPPHLQKGEDGKKAAPIDELSIDLGLTAQAAKDLVAAGDCVTFAKHFTPLNGSRVSANCLDDRSGVAAVLLAAEQLKDAPCRVTLLFTAHFGSAVQQGTAGPCYGKSDTLSNGSDGRAHRHQCRCH